MNDPSWNGIYTVGVAQGVFLVAALLLRRRRNRRAAGALTWIVGVFTLMTAVELLQGSLDARGALRIDYLAVNAELAIGPLALMFARSLADPGRPRSRREALHFLPLVLGLGTWSCIWLLVDDPARPFGMQSEAVFGWFVLVKASLFSAYAVATYRALERGFRARRGSAAGRRGSVPPWLRRWVTGLCALVGVIYLSVLLDSQGVPMPLGPDQVGTLLLMTAIYLASLMLLIQPSVLSVQPAPASPRPRAIELDRLTAYLERERPWLDPELGRKDLAAALGTTENRISAAIHQGLSTSFYGLLARYRLAEFERLARDPRLRDRTVLELALRAGFNSKASFYRKFREVHDTTPSAYRRTL